MTTISLKKDKIMKYKNALNIQCLVATSIEISSIIELVGESNGLIAIAIT